MDLGALRTPLGSPRWQSPVATRWMPRILFHPVKRLAGVKTQVTPNGFNVPALSAGILIMPFHLVLAICAPAVSTDRQTRLVNSTNLTRPFQHRSQRDPIFTPKKDPSMDTACQVIGDLKTQTRGAAVDPRMREPFVHGVDVGSGGRIGDTQFLRAAGNRDDLAAIAMPYGILQQIAQDYGQKILVRHQHKRLGHLVLHYDRIVFELFLD